MIVPGRRALPPPRQLERRRFNQQYSGHLSPVRGRQLDGSAILRSEQTTKLQVCI